MPVRFINDRYALSPNPRSGGMADVYRARDYDREERLVAVTGRASVQCRGAAGRTKRYPRADKNWVNKEMLPEADSKCFEQASE